MKKFIRFLGFLLMLTLIFNSVAFAEEDYVTGNDIITEDNIIELEVDIYDSMEEYQKSVAETMADVAQTRAFVEAGAFKISLIRAKPGSTSVTTVLNFIGGNVVIDEIKFKQVKVTRDTNLGLPVYMEIGTGLTDLYMPMASGVTTLGIANIPTDQTKARFSAIGLAGHCTYHNEYHSINDLGNGGITIQ